MNRKNQETLTKYGDIIHLPHHVSKSRPQMEIYDRAAQFSPFAALTGYDAKIAETQRLTDSFIELDENRKSVLNERLQVLLEKQKEAPKVSITYFQPDKYKAGGKYVEYEGKIIKIDGYEGCVITEKEEKIKIEWIYDIHIL